MKRVPFYSATEDEIHEGVLAYVRLALRNSALVFHTPNEGKRSVAYAARMKRLGLIPGVHDITILLPGGRVAFLEVKTAAGRLSTEQKAFGEVLDWLGIPWAVVRSIDEAKVALQRMGVALEAA